MAASLSHPATIDHETTATRDVAERHVGSDVQAFYQREILVDDSDAVAVPIGRIVHLHWRAIYPHLAAVAVIDARHNFQGRGLTGPVVTDDGVDFARKRRKVDASSGP